MTDEALRALERAVRGGASEEAGRLVHSLVRAGKLHPDRGDLLQHLLDREGAVADLEAWLGGLRAWAPEVAGLALYAIGRACGAPADPRQARWERLLPEDLPRLASAEASAGRVSQAGVCLRAATAEFPVPEAGVTAWCAPGELPRPLWAAFSRVLLNVPMEPLRASTPVGEGIEWVPSGLTQPWRGLAYHHGLKRFGELVSHDPEYVETREELLRYRVPALAPELEVGERDGCVYLFREYRRGVPFTEWLKAGPSLRARMEVAVALARGLHPYRPLRCRGVSIDAEGRPWLNDSGVFVSSVENPHGYAEVLDDKDGWSMLADGPTAATGLHAQYAETRAASLSIGAMLVDMFSAQPVFQLRANEGTTTALMGRVYRREFESELALPEPLRPIVARALHRDVSARYPTPNDMVSDLEAARDALG